MSPYRAPLRDLAFVIRELAGLDAVAQLPGNTEATPDLVEAVLDEAAAFASGVLEPLDAAGDREGARWHDGGVSMPAGFTAAYRQFADAGWIGLPFPPEYGGQGLPMLVGAAVLEMWSAANLGFANGPDLNAGAIEALLLCGSPEQKQLYVPRLISGQWTGTMVLTEPQAGSDLAAVRTLAVPDGDHYRISGQKIFITYGEHDMAENIVHLVLARTPTAPPGVKGISLFIVPKFVVNADGTLGKRNDVYCASIEHKLGIRASPTCVLNYGESGGAIGYLVGEENRGLEYMFVMMNRARFAVGVQGLGQADRAYQRALAYALERVQGKSVASRDPSPVAIVHHPDVRRMLMTMKSQIEAMRALALVVAAALDHAHNDPDPAIRAEEQAFSELMTPIVKGWLTETSLEIVSTAVQVHGGMGFIEESGAPQSYRDARITAI
ncbi:MAG: acyl-CoA dehydrogenase family protein, partial [Vulcanimicrobiaceae bacterium]